MGFRRILTVPVAVGLLTACGDSTGPGGGGTVTLRFTMAQDGPAMGQMAAGLNLGSVALAALPITGTNGTLTLDGAWLVVKKVELEAVEGSGPCPADDDDDGAEMSRTPLFHGGDPDDDDDDGDGERGDDCSTRLGPFFVEVPLEAETGAEVSVDVVPGTYEEIELNAGAPEGAEHADLLATIRAAFPDWPAEASLLVVGSFTPTDGDPASFRVYFHARIEIEREFEDDPLVVEEGGDLTVTVTIDPTPWLTRSDGTVKDLSAWDYDTFGEVVDLGVRSGEGCRIDRDDD